MSIKKREYVGENGRVCKTRYRVRWSDYGVDGKRRQRSKEFATWAEAKTFEAEVRLQAMTEKDARRVGRRAGIITLAALWDEYVAEKRRNGDLEPSTLRTYASVWNNHLAEAVGSITLMECDGTSRARDRAVGSLKHKGVSNSTKRKALGLLGAMLTYAQDYNLIRGHTSSPRRGTFNAKSSVRQARMFSIGEIEAVRSRILKRKYGSSKGYTAAERNTRDALFLSLLAYAGMRPAEVMGLQWKHIVLAEEPAEVIVQVRQQVADGQAKPVKNANAADQAAIRDIRDLPLPLIEDIRAWQAASQRTAGDDFLFHRANGLPWSKTVYKKWSSTAFKAGVEQVVNEGHGELDGSRPYDLRHSMCMTYPLVGLNPLQAAQRAGHTTAVAYEWYVKASQNPDALKLDGIDSWKAWQAAVQQARGQAEAAREGENVAA